MYSNHLMKRNILQKIAEFNKILNIFTQKIMHSLIFKHLHTNLNITCTHVLLYMYTLVILSVRH